MRPAEGQCKTDVWKGKHQVSRGSHPDVPTTHPEGELSLLPHGALAPAATSYLPEDTLEVSALPQS